MEAAALRALIREKLQDGRLPFETMSRFWSGLADGKVCDACDQPIPKEQLVLEGLASTLSDQAKEKTLIHFHVACFQVWDALRSAPHR